MELGEEWEFLSSSTLCTSETTEEKSHHIDKADQHQVLAQVDRLSPAEDAKEIIGEGDPVPRLQVEMTGVEIEEKEVHGEENLEIETSRNSESAEEEEDDGSKKNLKWGVRGLIVGAVSSLGVAAASFTMLLLLGGCKRNVRNGELQGIRQVGQRATKQNKCLSAGRGTPAQTTADISFGGYYHGL